MNNEENEFKLKLKEADYQTKVKFFLLIIRYSLFIIHSI